MTAALRLTGITKRFGPLVANDAISLELAKGEVLALLGENGAGKSTLVSILFGHYVPDEGSIEAFGAPLPAGDPAAAPRIQPRYLSTEEDQHVAADAIRVARRIMTQPALAPFRPDEYLPGPSVPNDDDAALAKAAGDVGTTIFHPVATAKMGLPSDPLAVVDERLRVFGMERLRVIDASVMPTITSGNTNAPTIMIAEKGADMIKEDAKSGVKLAA